MTNFAYIYLQPIPKWQKNWQWAFEGEKLEESTSTTDENLDLKPMTLNYTYILWLKPITFEPMIWTMTTGLWAYKFPAISNKVSNTRQIYSRAGRLRHENSTDLSKRL